MRHNAQPSSGVRGTAAALLVLAALVAATFSPLADAGFLAYDDPQYVTANRYVLEGLSLRGIAWALTSFEAANWHPLTWTSHMLDVSLFGTRPEPHHIVNIGLHAASALLLVLLLEAATGARWTSLFAAVLFALHPLRVESVAWISERKDVLSVLLGILTLLAYLRYAQRPGPWRYLGVAALFALGLAAKPMLVTLPALLLLLDWWPLGRLAAGARRGKLLLEKLPLLALAAAAAAVTWLAQQRGGAVATGEVFPPTARIANAVVSYATYLGDLVWPHDLIPFYRHLGLILTRTEIVLALAVLAGITAVALAVRSRRPWILAGWLWYLIALVPVIGLLQVGLQGKADRYTYLPFLGLCTAISWEAAAHGFGVKSARLRVMRGVAAAVVIAILSALTWNQACLWINSITLFSHVVAIDPKNYVAFNMLGSHYLLQGEAEQAQEFFARALALKAGYLPARYNLALALSRLGERDAAIAQFTALILANPSDAESLYNRGNLLAEQGQAKEALRDLGAALALQPGEAQIHNSLGALLAELGRLDEARRHFEEAIRLQPALAEARANLARATRERPPLAHGAPP